MILILLLTFQDLSKTSTPSATLSPNNARDVWRRCMQCSRLRERARIIGTLLYAERLLNVLVAGRRWLETNPCVLLAMAGKLSVFIGKGSNDYVTSPVNL